MIVKKSLLSLCILTLLTGCFVNAYAEQASSGTSAKVKNSASEAEIAKNKARILVKEKKWDRARKVAKKAVTLNPNDRDAWLILGTVEQRLEHPSEALKAFRKYLKLNPDKNKVTVVRQRIAELEVKEDAEKAAKKEARQKKKAEESRKYGAAGSGFFVGWSPLYKPKVGKAEDLNSGVSSRFDLGIRLAEVDFGLNIASGKVQAITVIDADSSETLYNDVDHVLLEPYMQFNVPLNAPYEKLGLFQFYIPLYLGAFWNRVTVGNTTYGNIGFALGTGGGVRLYTKSMFVFDLTALYHFALPFWDIRFSSVTPAIQNNSLQDVKGNVSGFELRLGLTLLL